MYRAIVEGGRRCRCATPGHRRVEHALTSLKRWERKLDDMESSNVSDERFQQAADRYIESQNRLIERERERGLNNSAYGPPEPTQADQYTPDAVAGMDDEHYSREHKLVWGQDPKAAYTLALSDSSAPGSHDDLEDTEFPTPPEEESAAPYDPTEHEEIGAMAGNLSRDEYAREEWERYSMGAYMDAEDRTGGSLLSTKGREAGIDAMSLFSGSAKRASKYASDELKAYWQENGRHTAASHRYTLLGRASDRKAYEHATTQARFDDAAAVL